MALKYKESPPFDFKYILRAEGLVVFSHRELSKAELRVLARMAGR